jgi:hypothetical protein
MVGAKGEVEERTRGMMQRHCPGMNSTQEQKSWFPWGKAQDRQRY